MLDFTPAIHRLLSSHSQERAGKEHVIGLPWVLLLPHLVRGKWLNPGKIESRLAYIQHNVYMWACGQIVIDSQNTSPLKERFIVEVYSVLYPTHWISDKCQELKGIELKIQTFLSSIFSFPLFIRTQIFWWQIIVILLWTNDTLIAKNLQEFIKGSHWGPVLAFCFGECIWVCVCQKGRGEGPQKLLGEWEYGAVLCVRKSFVLFG